MVGALGAAPRARGGLVAINATYFFADADLGDLAAGMAARPWGVGMADGDRFGEPHPDAVLFAIDDERRVRFIDGPLSDDLTGQAWSAERLPPATPDTEPQPRTAAGLDREHNVLLLVVVDGRQPTYSEGLTRVELAALMEELGADESVSLDGGGSSTMVDRERGVLNSPIHTRRVGRERPVATHLVIAAQR